MIHDLLAELALGRISEAEAEKIYDDSMDSGTVNIPELLGLSKEEWTAFAHGVDFRQLRHTTTTSGRRGRFAGDRTQAGPDEATTCRATSARTMLDVRSSSGSAPRNASRAASDSHSS